MLGLGSFVSLQAFATLLAIACYGGLIVLVARHSWRGNRLNQVFVLYLLTMVLWQLAYLMVAISTTPEGALFWYRIVIGVVSGQFVIYFLFIDTLLRVKSSSLLVKAGLGLWALALLWALLGREPSFYAGIRRDTATGLFVPLFGPLVPIIAVPNYLFLGYAVLNLLRAYRRTKSQLQRSRIQYLLLGVVVVMLGTLANFVPRWQPYPVDVAANIINAFLITYTIYRYQLLNIRLVVRKGLLYSIPTAIIGIAYFFVAYLAVQFLHLVTGEQLLLSLAMGAVTAAAVEPLRQRVQSWVDRLFFREQHDSGLMLQNLSRTAASVLDLDQLTGMLLDAVTSTMHIRQAAILLKQGAGGGFRLVAQRGLLNGSDLWFSDDHPMARWLREHERILERSEVEVWPLFKSLWGQEKGDLERLGAELFIPLKVKGDMVGIFAVGGKLSEQSYSQADRLTLSTLANQTAVAVENARLYAAEHRRVDESLVLLDIAAAVGSTLDLTPMLKIIARRTAQACGAQRCSIFLLDEENQFIQPLMSQYASGQRDEQAWARFQRGTYLQRASEVPALEQVIRDRRPLVLEADTVSRLPEAWTRPFNIHSLVVVPLISRDRSIGMMALDYDEAGRRSGPEQVNLAMTIGSQAAVAIENARLYEQTSQEKARTQTLLQETFSGIVVVDAQMVIVSMNPGAELITGYRAEEAVGKHIGAILGADVLRSGSPLAKAREADLKIAPVEVVVEARDGTRDILLGVTPLPTAERATRWYLLSFADISKLKEVDRLKSSIVANVSHELRTPLSSIKAYTELLLAEVEGADTTLRQEWLTVIDEATDRVTSLVDDILRLARLESQRVELVRELLDVEGVISKVISWLSVQAGKRGVTLRVEVANSLPRLLADRALLETVIKNLVDNAIKFSHDGGHVIVSAWQDDTVVKISVQDEGMGIPQDALPHLFAKFYRVASADAAAVQGTGLGLALVKEAVSAHGGHVEVKSTLGRGSLFTVTIPQEDGPSNSEQRSGRADVDRRRVS